MDEQEQFRENRESDLTSGYHALEADDYEERAEEAERNGQLEEAGRFREAARLARGRSRRTEIVEIYKRFRGNTDPDKV